MQKKHKYYRHISVFLIIYIMQFITICHIYTKCYNTKHNCKRQFKRFSVINAVSGFNSLDVGNFNQIRGCSSVGRARRSQRRGRRFDPGQLHHLMFMLDYDVRKQNSAKL